MKPISFDTTLSSFGNNTGIVVPDEAVKQLGENKRASLMVSVNGYVYQCTPGVMGGKTLISFSSQHREKSGIKGADAIHVELTLATEPRKVEMSEEFLQALQKEDVYNFFQGLSNSLQRYHCDLINSAKSDETKQKRIQKSIELFKRGKKR